MTSDVAADQLGPRTKIKGKLLAENCIIMIMLMARRPTWKNSSINYAHVLGDVDDNVVTVFLKKSVTIHRNHKKCPLNHV